MMDIDEFKKDFLKCYAYQGIITLVIFTILILK